MDPFDIAAILQKNNVIVTVIPFHNGENAYSTYFRLMVDKNHFCDLILDENYVWKVCKGSPLEQNEINDLVYRIEGHLYSAPEPAHYSSVVSTKSKPSAFHQWLGKIKNIFVWRAA